MLIVITKADLWWTNHDKVIRHYESGPYFKALRRGGQVANHAVAVYCAVFHKFYGEGPLAGTFDEHDRVRTRAHLLQQLVASVTEGGNGKFHEAK